jgi:hypothetical protein
MAYLSWLKTWTFWSGDDIASGIVFLLRGIILEDYAWSVYYTRQRRGEEGGGIV